MKRRDFLKMSLSAGVAAALPINVMGLTSCSDDDNTPHGDKPDLTGTADFLILGNIITIDDNKLFADAMTIKNGYVQYVGNEATARKFCKEGHTVERKYPGQTIYPGFMEAHCHGSSAGMIESTIKLFDGKTYKDYQKTIADYIKANPGKPFYRISGWQQSLPTESAPPTREMLDEVSGDNYVFGGSMDGHCFLMNTKTMNELKIDKQWADHYGPLEAPLGDDNLPTGYVTESAAAEVQRWFPLKPEAAEESIRKWQEFAFKNGFVCAAEAGVNLQPAFHDAYVKLAQAKELKLRTRAFWNVVMADANEAKVEEVAQKAKTYNDEYYKIIGLKIFIDGVAESHTALLTQRYTDVDTLGLDRYKDKTGDPDETLKKLVLSAHQHGLPTHTHTIGDGAVKKMLDAIEYAKNTTGDFSIRDMLAHIELVRPEDIKRFAKLNVTAIVAALWGPKYAVTDFGKEVELLGDRADHYYQVMNSFVKTGVNCAQHTDYPVSQAFGVPRAIYCGVTRCLPPTEEHGGKQSERLAEEAVTRLEMLKELTINVAKTWNEEHRMGSLTPGKIANYVVYDCDFIDDDVEKIPNAKLQQVVVDGEVVYEPKLA